MTKLPLKIGITGGIGSGKSTVAKVFQLLGIPVYTADERAKWLMANDPSLREKIKGEFGENSYDTAGNLNRSFLAEKVFSDPEKVKKINSLVHPAVADDFDQWVTQQRADYVLKEAALIFETGGEQKLDRVINVSAPLKIRVDRILARDSHRSLEQINKIIDQQLPDETKNEKADFVIKNSPNHLIIPQILTVHRKISALQL
ncbi:dephospho-CoA kinase [Algoriphagus namhaensis]